MLSQFVIFVYMPSRPLKYLFLILFTGFSVMVYAQNTIRLSKFNNPFKNRLLQVGDEVSAGLKYHKKSISGTIDQIDSGSFVIRMAGDSLLTVKPDSLTWIAAGKNRWGTRILGSLGKSLIAAGGLYFAFGMTNAYLLGYDLKEVLPGRIITGAVISGTGLAVTGIYYLIRAKRCKMGKWKLRINDFEHIGKLS